MGHLTLLSSSAPVHRNAPPNTGRCQHHGDNSPPPKSAGYTLYPATARPVARRQDHNTQDPLPSWLHVRNIAIVLTPSDSIGQLLAPRACRGTDPRQVSADHNATFGSSPDGEVVQPGGTLASLS